MPCYHPLRAYKAGVTKEGKLRLSFQAAGTAGVEVMLPCGSCIGCRLERARQWAVRCMHEADLHDANCFVTLTYDDAHIPHDRSLKKKDFQDFMKRFRKRCGKGIRYYHCGEYGESFGRPHYHALIFGYDFPDKVLVKESEGCKLFSSQLLSDLWQQGLCSVGALTYESAAYVARYVLKKVTGDRSDEAYTDPVTGVMREPEYTTMSRGGRKRGAGGIGQGWFNKFSSDVYPSDEVIVNGRECKPPRYYDNLLDKMDPVMLESVKDERRKEGCKLEPVHMRKVWNGREFAPGVVWLPKSDSDRLGRCEEIRVASLRLLKRSLE